MAGRNTDDTVALEEVPSTSSNSDRTPSPEDDLKRNDAKTAKLSPKNSLCTLSACFATYCAVLGVMGELGYGITIGYSSPLLNDLRNRANFTLWTEGFNDCIYQALIGPLAPSGAVLGAILSSLAVGALGLVQAMITSTIIYIIAWTLIGTSFFVPSPDWFRIMILVGRTLTGFSAGWIATVAPIYVAELAPPRLRGRIGGLIPSTIGLGSFICFVIGALLGFWQTAFVLTGINVCYLLLLLTVKESPTRSRNVIKNIKQMHGRFKYSVKSMEDVSVTGKKSSPFCTKTFLWQLLLTMTLYIYLQFTGINAITFYAGPVFIAGGAEGWGLDPGITTALCVGFAQIISGLLAAFVFGRISRQILLVCGALGMMVGNIALGTFFVLIDGIGPQEFVPVNSSNTSGLVCFFQPTPNEELGRLYSPLAIVGTLVFILSFGSCFASVVHITAAEVYADSTRAVGMAISVATNWTSVVIVTFLFPYCSNYLGTGASFYILAAVAATAAIFVPLFVPETKGKPLGWSSTVQFSVRRNLTEFFTSLRGSLCFFCGLARKCRLLGAAAEEKLKGKPEEQDEPVARTMMYVIVWETPL